MLVADDDPDLLFLSRMVLESLRLDGVGVEVISATSAEQGIEVLTQRGDIALVLLDLAMEQRQSGWKLYDAAVAGRGGMATQVIVRSGYASSRTEGVRDRFAPRILPKAASTAAALRAAALEGLEAHRICWLAWRLVELSALSDERLRSLTDEGLCALFGVSAHPQHAGTNHVPCGRDAPQPPSGLRSASGSHGWPFLRTLPGAALA